MSEHALEQPPLKEMSLQRFNADVDLLIGQSDYAAGKAEIAERFEAGTMTTKDYEKYDELHQVAYFNKRDAEIRANRVARRERLATLLGKFSLK